MESSTNTSICTCSSYLNFPWARKSPPYEFSPKGLNEQIEDFIAWISPTEEERKMREDVFSRITIIVKEIWPQASVEIVGSTCTNLCVPTRCVLYHEHSCSFLTNDSDIDISIFGVLSFDAHGKEIHKPVADEGSVSKEVLTLNVCLYKLARHLESIAFKDSVQVFSTAKVPIVKIRDAKSKAEVDISFGVNAGKENARVVLEYCEKFPLVRPLAFVIKSFLKQKLLNNSWSGGIGSYTLIIMIISYLQLHTTKEERESTNIPILHYILGFFKLYGADFDYSDSVISILNGGKYLKKSEKNWKVEKHPDFLAVEDPHNTENDLGRTAFKIEAIREAFSQTYIILNIQNSTEHAKAFGGDIDTNSLHFKIHRPDVTFSYLIWINSNIQLFRKEIRDLYRDPTSPIVEETICQLHPNTSNVNLLKNSNSNHSFLSEDYFYHKNSQLTRAALNGAKPPKYYNNNNYINYNKHHHVNNPGNANNFHNYNNRRFNNNNNNNVNKQHFNNNHHHVNNNHNTNNTPTNNTVATNPATPNTNTTNVSHNTNANATKNNPHNHNANYHNNNPNNKNKIRKNSGNNNNPANNNNRAPMRGGNHSPQNERKKQHAPQQANTPHTPTIPASTVSQLPFKIVATDFPILGMEPHVPVVIAAPVLSAEEFPRIEPVVHSSSVVVVPDQPIIHEEVKLSELETH